MRQKNIRMVCISALLLFATVLSINYSFSRRWQWNEYPFGLSGNYKVLLRTDNDVIKPLEIIDPNLYTDITVISEYPESEILGLYDPDMLYYNRIWYSDERYFSYDDYREGRAVGALITEYGDEPADRKSDVPYTECLFTADAAQPFCKEGYKYIVNLTSLNYLGKVIYLDGSDLAQVERFIDLLEQHGYKVEPGEEGSLLKMLGMSFVSHVYEMTVLLGTFCLYFLLVIADYYYFYMYRKVIKIHQLNGGRVFRTFYYLCKNFLIYNVLMCSCVWLFIYLYRRAEYIWLITNMQWLEVIVLHICITSLEFFAGYLINYFIVRREAGTTYVK